MPSYPKPKIKKMKYDSPSGEVFIGKYAPPFIPVKNGFGFYGVLLLDVKQDVLQCHICGEWFGILHTHICAKHKINANEYRDEFGLFRSTALINEATRESRRANMVRMRETGELKYLRRFPKKNKISGNRRGKAKAYEAKNKFGVCHAQLVNAIKILADKLGKTPTLGDLIKEYGGAFVTNLHYTFGSYPELCKKLGMIPNYSSVNPRYNREIMIQLARDFYKRYNRLPSGTDYRRGTFPDGHSIVRALGVKNAKQANDILKKEIVEKQRQGWFSSLFSKVELKT